MKKNKKIIFFIILFLSIFFIKTKVNATNISISPKEPKVGDTVTITVTVPNVHTVDVTANVLGVVSGTIKVVGGDLGGTAKSYTETAKYTCKTEGNINVSVSSSSTAVLNGKYVDVKGSASAKVTKKTSNNTTNNNTTDNNSNVSSDATLKNFGITPNDFSGFKKATTTYNVSVPKNTEKISIYATPTNSKAQVSGTGSKTLKIGKNTFNVKVTAEDKKTTKTYTLNITRKSEDEVSTDATLSNLGVRPKEYDFTGFKPNTTDYKIVVPNEVEKINIYATATNSKSKVEGTGEKQLKVGENKFEIKVTAEDKKATKIYNLSVTRDEDETEQDSQENNQNSKIEGITNIKLESYSLNPEFNTETYEYSVELPEGTTKIEVNAETSSKDIEVEVVGNDELKEGKNIITIIAKNTKTAETKTYQISATVGEQEINLSTANKEIDAAKKSWDTKRWIIRGAIIIIILLILLFLVYQYRLQTKDDYDDEFDEDRDESEDDYDESENDNENKEIFSETHNFYNQMKDNDIYKEDTNEDSAEYKKSSKYKGKRFK